MLLLPSSSSNRHTLTLSNNNISRAIPHRNKACPRHQRQERRALTPCRRASSSSSRFHPLRHSNCNNSKYYNISNTYSNSNSSSSNNNTQTSPFGITA